MAQAFIPRIRVYSDTEGTVDFEVAARGFGSLSFAEALAAGLIAANDTVDYCASYGDAFEEGTGTVTADGDLERTSIAVSRHSNGTIDTNKVSWAPGRKTIVAVFKAERFAPLLDLQAGALRFSEVQSLTTDQIKQVLTNAAGVLWSAADVTNAAPVWPTGRMRSMVDTTAAAGWLLLNDGTFGDASSGASARANADCLALFTMIYNNMADSFAPVFTSSGTLTNHTAQGSAAAAWAAHCRLSLPKSLGRLVGAAGAGSGLTLRQLGQPLGSETKTLSTTDMPPHNHGGNTDVESNDHNHGVTAAKNITGFTAVPDGGAVVDARDTTITTGGASAQHRHPIASQGSGGAHDIMPPAIYLNWEIKL
jgi:microcystin-dependent protein